MCAGSTRSRGGRRGGHRSGSVWRAAMLSLRATGYEHHGAKPPPPPPVPSRRRQFLHHFFIRPLQRLKVQAPVHGGSILFAVLFLFLTLLMPAGATDSTHTFAVFICKYGAETTIMEWRGDIASASGHKFPVLHATARKMGSQER